MSVLDDILAAGVLSVVFQPIFELGGEAPVLHGLECLVRGPKGSNLHSAEVLFEYVRRKHEEARMDRACVEAVLFAARELPKGLRLTLNVHASTLARDPDFLNHLGDTASRYGIGISPLVVEIVDHAPPWSVSLFQNALQGLRAIGVRIALDDIGLGQSSYMMIIECRPNYFKIDRCLVSGCHADPYRRAVVDSIVRLARSFGARVVAEGVESAEDLRAIQAVGVDLVQGYLLSRPLPSAELLASGLLGRAA
jgi:EAL domain-containing protein (putative c-di-GMP-specific phosphodiesterase class I)